MFKRYTPFLVIALAILGAGLSVVPAVADSPAPGWEVFTRVSPTNLPPGGEGTLLVYVYNVGAAEGAYPHMTDTLPAGVTATGSGWAVNPASGFLGYGNNISSGSCAIASPRMVSCTPTEVPPGDVIEIYIQVHVEAGVSGSAVNQATVVGGGALSPASKSTPVSFGAVPSGFGFEGLDGWFTNADGTSDTQAGSHPYELTVVYAMNSNGIGNGRESPAGGEVRDLIANLPPGIVGNPTAVPRCSRAVFDGEVAGSENPSCPPSTQVGVDQSSVSSLPISFKVYNLVPPPGVAAQFAFNFDGNPVFLDAGVRSGGSTPLSNDYGISEHVNNVPQREIFFNATTIWGVPGEASHNLQRSEETTGPGVPSGAGLTPFLTVPTSCEGPLEFSIEAQGTWQNPSASASASFLTHDSSGTPTGMTGCDHMGFEPSITVAPDTSHADTPAGLTVNVEAPQASQDNAEGLSTSNIKETTVALPEGVVINPGQAVGLAACQPSEDGRSGEGPPSCPAASKVGTVEIETPLLFDKLQGNVYIMQSNPPEIQLLVAASGDGVNLKLIGTVHLSETTGQLVTTFANTPELPFSHFKLSFSGGAQAALATPTRCGSYTTTSDFTPWSSPLVPNTFPSNQFVIESGPGGGPCENPQPFTPTLTAGSTTDQAGGYTNFSMLLQRGDGQQRIDGLQFKAPKGLTGFLSKVPLCTNAQAEANACPEASKIGHAVIESGPGPYPLVVPEPGQPPAPIYLTEAYDGAPFGLSIVVPLHVGPFTLPTQRVRARIEINSRTSQLTVTTDPLPQEVAGVPTDLREVDAVIERPEFMVNPTNCEPQEFSGTAFGTPPPGQSGAGASAPISSHFQVGACRALRFEPKFTVSTSGKTSRASGASLTAKVSYPNVPQGTDTDIGYVKIELPKQLPSRLTTLQKACTNARFEANPATCPAESKIGYATVHTALLPVALSGPVIFVSHGGEAFPSLTMVLQGDGVTIDLVGTTFISKAGITSTTFSTIPDDPFSTFEITLPQGKYSALAANGNLCKQALTMPTQFIGQNGAEIHQSTPIEVTGCPDSLSIASHSIKKATATLSVYVPAAGTVKVSGNGLPTKSAKTKGRVTLTFKLTQRKTGKLSTKVSVIFTPSAGRDRKKQSKSVSLKFAK